MILKLLKNLIFVVFNILILVLQTLAQAVSFSDLNAPSSGDLSMTYA